MAIFGRDHRGADGNGDIALRQRNDGRAALRIGRAEPHAALQDRHFETASDRAAPGISCPDR